MCSQQCDYWMSWQQQWAAKFVNDQGGLVSGKFSTLNISVSNSSEIICMLIYNLLGAYFTVHCFISFSTMGTFTTWVVMYISANHRYLELSLCCNFHASFFYVWNFFVTMLYLWWRFHYDDLHSTVSALQKRLAAAMPGYSNALPDKGGKLRKNPSFHKPITIIWCWNQK